MTIGDLLKNSYSLVEAGKVSFLDLEVLLSYALGVEREYLLAHDDEEVDLASLNVFQAYLERILAGEPVAYITNRKEFYGLDFFVDKRVLIPRPETEQIVERAVEFMVGRGEGGLKILDVGTGSGNMPVAIMTALGIDDEDFVESFLALDVSPDAVEVARLNVLQHGLEHKIDVLQSDLLEVVDDGEEFSVIVANLPYIGREKNRFVEQNVEKYEPNVALFGGNDGTELYDKLFQQLIEREIGFGMLLGEFGFAQGEIMGVLLEKYFPGRWVIENDLAGIERIFKVVN